MKKIFGRFYLWFCWSRYLRCKGCCVFCKYYEECVEEIHDLERRLDINGFLD